MRFSDLLSTGSIKIPLVSRKKDEIVQELIGALPLEVSDELRRTIFRSVMEREDELSTGLGEGIALPHGTAPIGQDAAAAMGVSPEPVEFGALDGRPVHVVILLVTDQDHPTLVVETLSMVARLLHSPEFRQALTSCSDCGEALRVIRKAEG